MQGGQSVTIAECVYVWRVIPGLLCAAQVHQIKVTHLKVKVSIREVLVQSRREILHCGYNDAAKDV